MVIRTHNDAERLAACLAPLVPASMEGVVRQLVVADRGSTDQTLEIADDAGALIIPGATVEEAIAKARGPWILALDVGVQLEFGWESAAKRRLEAGRGIARFRIETLGGGLFARLFAPPVAAHLFPKSEAARVGLRWSEGRLEARVGQVDRLDARGRRRI